MESPFPRMQPGEHMSPVQFGDQASDGIGVFGSPGLSEQQEAYNRRFPRAFRPSSSLNGMSADQYEQTLGGAFPVQNGIAKNQYDVAKFSMSKDE